MSTLRVSRQALVVSDLERKTGKRNVMFYEVWVFFAVLREIILDSGKMFHLFETLFLLLRGSTSWLSDRGIIIAWEVSRKLRYLWAICLSGSRQRHRSMFPTISAWTLTLEWAWHPRLRTARGLSRKPMWVLWTLNKRVKHASSAQ
jgi:hypothetical protein